SGSENSHAEYAYIGVARPSMAVAISAARSGVPIPTSSRKKNVTVSAAKVALLRQEAKATTKSVSGGNAGQARQHILPHGVPRRARNRLPRRISRARLAMHIRPAIKIVQRDGLRHSRRPVQYETFGSVKSVVLVGCAHASGGSQQVEELEGREKPEGKMPTGR